MIFKDHKYVVCEAKVQSITDKNDIFLGILVEIFDMNEIKQINL